MARGRPFAFAVVHFPHDGVKLFVTGEEPRPPEEAYAHAAEVAGAERD